MLNYESAYSKFPKATQLDAQGQPMHSWRVRILPYIEEQALYDQYDFSQPWDSPNNLKLLDQMPECFRCPYRKETNRTSYKLVIGPGTLFDGGERSFGRLADGSSNTIAIVEDGANPVEWTRPSDLSIDEAIAALAPEDFKNLPHVVDSIFETTYSPGCVVFFDGSTHYVRDFNGSDPTILRNMLQINDGNIIDFDEFVSGGSFHTVPNHGARVVAILFLILMTYPLVWVFRPNDNVTTQN